METKQNVNEKRVQVYIPVDLRKQARIAAAQTDMTVGEFVEVAVKEKLQRMKEQKK